MPIFFLPIELFETMSHSLYSFLDYIVSDSIVPCLVGVYLVYRLFNKCFYFLNIKPEHKIKPKKDKLTLKERIMRLRGFDHYKEKEDKNE